MKNLTQCIRGGSKEGRNGFLIAFHYDEDVVESLKQHIPHTEREWREDSKTWWISVQYETVLKRYFGNFEALVYLQGSLF
uniref:Uncharacterized protein n=1 Tax=viral metagenome TaxID=1070528 RepID=A0A6M3KEC3_9ZZZZ